MTACGGDGLRGAHGAVVVRRIRVEFTSRWELGKWLGDKPREWAQAIALRAALRVLPVALDPARFRDGRVDPRLMLAVFRATASSSGAGRIPPDNKGLEADPAAAPAYAASYADPVATDPNTDTAADIWATVASDCSALANGIARPRATRRTNLTPTTDARHWRWKPG